jgi:hypothetical protein
VRFLWSFMVRFPEVICWIFVMDLVDLLWIGSLVSLGKVMGFKKRSTLMLQPGLRDGEDRTVLKK